MNVENLKPGDLIVQCYAGTDEYISIVCPGEAYNEIWGYHGASPYVVAAILGQVGKPAFNFNPYRTHAFPYNIQIIQEAFIRKVGPDD